jgi:hypothetical protein
LGQKGGLKMKVPGFGSKRVVGYGIIRENNTASGDREKKSQTNYGRNKIILQF